MKLVLIYSILVGLVFLVWLIAMVKVYQDNYTNKN